MICSNKSKFNHLVMEAVSQGGRGSIACLKNITHFSNFEYEKSSGRSKNSIPL